MNFAHKYSLFSEQWTPKVVAQMNDYQFKVVKIEGDFVWHSHADTDETFIVLEGALRIDFRDGAVQLGAGEMFVVPKGIEHKPYAE
ncbi:cupin domain-containing protein, partial [Salmonella enterica subsp. enterica]